MIPPTKEQVLQALAQTDELVPGPRILSQALRLLSDPKADLRSIAELIRCDSALAVEVLRCANSVYYNRKTRAVDLDDAVQVIGFSETVRLVSLVTTRTTTNRNLGNYGIAAEDFWAESLFNGLFLEALAQRFDIADAAEAYTTGLLRFVGRLAIEQVLTNLGGGLFWDSTAPLCEWERDNVGLTQAEVGTQLLRKWGFPEAMALAIEAQDFSTLNGSDPEPPLVRLAHFGAQVLPAGGGLAAINSRMSPVIFSPDDPFVKEHSITVESVSAARATACRAFLSVRELLSQ